MSADDIAPHIVAALGEARARELLDVLTRPEADRAALIGRLALRADGQWLAEVLTDLEVGRGGAARRRGRAPGELTKIPVCI